MKINKLFIYITALSLTALQFVSCNDDDNNVDNFTVDKENIHMLIGNKELITVNGLPSNNVASSAFEWTSSDEGIATVTQFGVVTGVEEGEADITITYNGQLTKKVHIVVTDPIVVPAKVGSWLFDDASNILKASVGNDLQIGANNENPSLADFVSVSGPQYKEGNMAVRIKKGYYFLVDHGIQPKNGELTVNEYTVAIDFKVDALNTWYTFLQMDPTNKRDADVFINKSGKVGVGSPGYSDDVVIKPGQWQRLIASFKMGENGWVKYFIDGTEIFSKTEMMKEDLPRDNSRFCMTPLFILFGDNDGDDGLMDVAEVALWDVALDVNQAKKADRLMSKSN